MTNTAISNKDYIINSFLEDQKKLFLTALAITNNIHNAEDAMQECFIKISKKCLQLKDINYCKTWTMRILINTCKDLIRKSNNNVFINDIPEKELFSFDKEESNFFELINNLALDEKHIITLYYFNEFTLEDISKVIGRPLSTVKSRYYRALVKLKKDWSD